MKEENPEGKEGSYYIVLIAQSQYYVKALRNEDARYETAAKFLKEHREELDRKVCLTDITFWAQAFKIDERGLVPLKLVLRGLNLPYKEEKPVDVKENTLIQAQAE